MGREDEIRIIAYRLWEEEGYCHGRDVEHWMRAEIIWQEQNGSPEIELAAPTPKSLPVDRVRPQSAKIKGKVSKSGRSSSRRR